MVPLKLILNGRSQEFVDLQSGASMEQLLVALVLKPDRVAVERNGEIVPRAQWPSTFLLQDDRLEVVHFVGGGSPGSGAGRIQPIQQ